MNLLGALLIPVLVWVVYFIWSRPRRTAHDPKTGEWIW